MRERESCRGDSFRKQRRCLSAAVFLIAAACSRSEGEPKSGQGGGRRDAVAATAEAMPSGIDAGQPRAPADVAAAAEVDRGTIDAGRADGDAALASAEREPGLELLGEAGPLWRDAACATDPTAARPSPVVVEHCRRLARMVESYRAGWMARAGPFFRGVVPADVPRVVVYPFGGADLLTALVVFPEAESITTLGLEAAGDLRIVANLDEPELRRALDGLRRLLGILFTTSYSGTVDLAESTRQGVFPTHLAFSLVALALHGFEPISIRYFALEPDGAVRYLEAADLAAGGEGEDPIRRNRLLGDVEVRFRRADRSDSTVRVYRHICGDLSDAALAGDDRVLRHLESLADVAGIVKAASYLLWRGGFERVERYLLERVVWLASDSTGPDPQAAEAAGLEQAVWGRFAGPILVRSERPDLVELWRRRPFRPLTFVFGYPDIERHGHLVVTQRPSPDPSSRDGG